jgi:hypothetical protein
MDRHGYEEAQQAAHALAERLNAQRNRWSAKAVDVGTTRKRAVNVSRARGGLYSADSSACLVTAAGPFLCAMPVSCRRPLSLIDGAAAASGSKRR